MASENTELAQEKQALALSIAASLDQTAALIRDQLQTGEPPQRGRAFSLAITKLDEARLWLAEACA